MRWFHIRVADIEDDSRTVFERYGTTIMQIVLANNTTGWDLKGVNIVVNASMIWNAKDALPVSDIQAWLTEQYDRAERKETWSLTMEFAITVFVLAELLLSIGRLVSGTPAR